MSLATRPPAADHQAAGTQPEPGQPEPAAERSGPRGRLRLPHGLTSVRFALIVGALLTAGLVLLLAVNTSLAAGAIRLSSLESKLARATEQREALEIEVDAISSPAALQLAAAGLGMVPAVAPAFLDPATGQVSGVLTPAVEPAEPFEQAPQVAPEPTPAPTAAPEEAAPRAIPPLAGPDGRPVPGPIPTAPVAVDPGSDGAVVVRPGTTSGTAATLVPSPTPAPIPVAGDAASVVTQEGD